MFMKPFSLEEYLKNPFRKLITRDKRKARIICTNKKGNYPIIALIEKNVDNEIVNYYYEDGRTSHINEDNLDLFFAPEKKEGWVNIFKTDIDMFKSGRIYNSKTEAKESIVDEEKYVDTVKIEWEE